MENLELILSLAGAGAGLIIAIATVIVKYAGSAKARKVAEQTIEICNAILPYIVQAESYVHYSGEEKKEYVMTKVNQYAIENRIAFDKQAVSAKVEELVELTKEVNARDNDKTITEPEESVDAAKAKKIITIPVEHKRGM